MNSEILAQVFRGETVESIHRGHLIVVEGDGNPVLRLGEPETVTFYRSACKAFQAIPFITSGGADRFDFDLKDIALACASHSGEPLHVATAEKMLEKAGFTEPDLRCGAHLPFNDSAAEAMIRRGEKPNQLHNNCSGKHAAMLAFAKHIEADAATYEHLGNPVQQEILKCVSKFSGVAAEKIAVAVDGCAAPNFAIPVSAMALSFSRLVFPPADYDEPLREACSRVVSAMVTFPELIGGSGRLDTLIMKASNGRVISKVGADGVYAAAVLPCEQWKTGLGIAFKIEDGDDKRARPAAAVELLRRLGALAKTDLPEVSPMPIKNRRGDVVGRVQAAF